MQEHFQILARYNAWANHRLYGAIENLPDEEIRKQRTAAYFGSILGTLNHLLVADRLWMARFEGRESENQSLDRILHDTIDELKISRRAEDRRIIDFIDRMSPRLYEQRLAYRNTKGESASGTYGQLFAHLFNHQTHHRGQVHALVKDAGQEPPPLDLLYYLRG